MKVTTSFKFSNFTLFAKKDSNNVPAVHIQDFAWNVIDGATCKLYKMQLYCPKPNINNINY